MPDENRQNTQSMNWTPWIIGALVVLGLYLLFNTLSDDADNGPSSTNNDDMVIEQQEPGTAPSLEDMDDNRLDGDIETE